MANEISEGGENLRVTKFLANLNFPSDCTRKSDKLAIRKEVLYFLPSISIHLHKIPPFFFLPFLSLRGKLLFFTLLMWVSLSPQASPSSSLLIHNPINIFAFSPFKKFLLLLGESLLRHGNIPGVRWIRALIQLYSILKLWMGEELQWGEIGSRTRAKVNMVLPFLLQSSYQREVWTS